MTVYTIQYYSGTRFQLAGQLRFGPGIYPDHPDVLFVAIIADGKTYALDPRATIYDGETIVFEGCSNDALLRAQGKL